MSPREDFLLDNIPPLPADLVVGRCSHTCVTRANMGVKDPQKIGMRYHYVSALVSPLRKGTTKLMAHAKCTVCKLTVKHDLKPHSPETQQALQDLLAVWDQEHRSPRKAHRRQGERKAQTPSSPATPTKRRRFALGRIRVLTARSESVEIVDVRLFSCPSAHLKV